MVVRKSSSRNSSERSVPDRFKNFDLSIEQFGEVYRAHVTGSPVGAKLPISIDPAQLDITEPAPGGSTGRTRDVRRQSFGHDDLRRAGERLFRAVFDDEVAEAFRASVVSVRAEHAGLRIRLFLDRASELASLPWEALWDPTDRAFLADQPDLPIVRALGATSDTTGLAPAEAPLRLLALLPEPRGEGKLGGATEWKQIREHLVPLAKKGLVEPVRVEPSTLEALGQHIDRGPCHVLHIVAHGASGGSGSGGVLKLENASGGSDSVEVGDLARALERGKAPHLVVLNACHGARAAVDDVFNGLAQRLLSRGVPAVVAMRTAISDAAAVSFAAVLYRELASGRTIETAVVEARRTLSLGKHRTEWATPVLYLQRVDVRIFAFPPGGGSLISGRGARRKPWRAVASGIAIAAAIGAAALLLTKGPTAPAVDSDRCPALPGLHDLSFVVISPDVVTIGDRSLIVKDEFCIATKEVSRRDWQEVMGGDLRRAEWPLEWPMTDVTPEDAESFLRQLEARDPGVTYRLPTDAEWEFAARADQQTAYFFGDDASQLHRYGNCKNILETDSHEGPSPIGSYQPNAWGLYDVHGNVAEWIQWPEDAGSSLNEEGQQLAMRLGGSFENTPENCSFPAPRSRVRADDGNRMDTGFRVVQELVSQPDE